MSGKGIIGEIKAYNYLTSQGYDIVDVRQNEDYWKVDTDYIAKKNGIQTNIEIKWDYRIAETHNMFIERLTDIDNNKDGWFRQCTAQIIYYGDAINNLFYIFSLDDLKDYIENNFVDQRRSADYNRAGQVKKVSQGYIVPIEDFRKQYQVAIADVSKL